LLPLFVQLAIADWFVFCTLCVLVGARRGIREGHHNCWLLFVFVPIHIAYLVIILIGVIPKAAKAECSKSVVYPPIMIATDSLNLFVFLLSLLLHKMKYFIEWNIVADDSALTAKEFEDNEVKKL
jgi:hypothetical protein